LKTHIVDGDITAKADGQIPGFDNGCFVHGPR
jgi:hypothetical protein